jgi:hypothetical protein
VFALVLAVVAGLGLTGAPRARADGDPASDILASQSLFLPADGGFTVSEETQLDGLVTAAQRSGYPIRVALVATPTDLGSVSELWRMPSSYARFLALELSQVFRGTLLVVMPDGFGVTAVAPVGSHSQPVAGATTIPAAHAGESMVAAAAAAVQHLAAADGHPVRAPSAPAGGTGSGSWLGSVDLGSWLALVIGAALIALAWAASLRAGPPARLRRAR